MTDDEYNALPGLRWSKLRNILVSPRRYQHCLRNRADTPSMRQGRIIHCGVLTPDLFAVQSVVAPPEFVTGSGTLSASKKSLEWLSAQPSPDMVVTAEDVKICSDIRAALLDHDDARPLLENADKVEHVFSRRQWVSGMYVDTKARVDGITGLCLWDLKTYGGRNPLTPQVAINEIVRRQYHAQLGYYERVTGCEFERFAWVFVSTDDYDVVVIEADDDMMQYGREVADEALIKYGECMTIDKWPGVAPAKVVASLPGWAIPSDGDVAEGLGLEGFSDE